LLRAVGEDQPIHNGIPQLGRAAVVIRGTDYVAIGFPLGTARLRFGPPHFSWFSSTSLRDPANAESTLRQRNIHGIKAGSPYSELVRQAAFIVQLWTTEGSQFAGLVEDVGTGKQVKFLCEQELLDFLRERFHPDAQSDEQKEGTDERKDGRR
jgi:hypothetical protein